MRVIGFDIASRTGYAVVVDRPGQPPCAVIENGIVKLDKKQNRPRQLEWFRQDVFKVLSEAGHLDAIAYERVSVAHSRNAETIAGQNEMYGAFQIACCNYNPDIPIVRVTPNVWHRDILGIVANTKLLKSHAIENARLRAGFETTDEDIADSICVGIYALGCLRLGLTA